MLYIRTLEAREATPARRSTRCSGREFLVRRPLLDAIEHDDVVPPVLLIDEIDRADDEFEAFLLELLSDFQVTIPEIGTIARRAAPRRDPDVEPHARAARRAQAPLPLPLDRPPVARARDRDRARARARRPRARSRPRPRPSCSALRTLDLAKAPGVAETIDWAQALVALGQSELDADVVDATLGAVLKYHEDLERVRDHGLQQLLAEARRPLRARAELP